MLFQSFDGRLQLPLNDLEFLVLDKKFQYLYTQHIKLEGTNNLSYSSLSRDLMSTFSQYEKILEERREFSHESFLRPLNVHIPSSPTSSSSRST